MHDVRILRSSQVYTKSEAGEIITILEKVINNENFLPLLLGDGVYPQTSWLIKSYANNTLLPLTQKKFNKELLRARVIVERSSSPFKGCWCPLLKRLGSDNENVDYYILHYFT